MASSITGSAVISGGAGQDASLLAELLLDKGYTVYSLVRPSPRDTLRNLHKCLNNPHFNLIKGDLLSLDTINELCYIRPQEFYHLGALTHVGASFDNPVLTLETNTIATARILNGLRDISPTTRLYFAATSEMHPDSSGELGANSPYAASKVAAHLMVQQYRKAYGMFCVSGTAYNNESRRRPNTFVTRKLCEGILAYKRGMPPVMIGDDSVFRDWHYAGDTVRGMWLALQQDTPRDYTFASGRAHTVREWGEAVCRLHNVEYKDAVVVGEGERRPLDVTYLLGNYEIAREHLGWYPSMNFEQLVVEVCQPHD